MGLERFARPLLLHFVGACEQCFEVTELLEQLDRSLFADPLDAGDVVGRVAHEREPVGDLRRRHAKARRRVGFGDPHLLDAAGPAAPGIEQRDARADQLIEVLVAGYDDGRKSLCCGANGEGADDVVSLVPGHFDQRDAEAGKQRAHTLHGAIEVGLQLVVELFSGGLVLGVLRGAKRVAGVVDPHEIIRTVFLAQSEEKVGHAPDRGRILAPGGAQWPTDQREKRPINQGIAVHEEELGRRVFWHPQRITRARRRGLLVGALDPRPGAFEVRP